MLGASTLAFFVGVPRGDAIDAQKKIMWFLLFDRLTPDSLLLDVIVFFSFAMQSTIHGLRKRGHPP
eukprot:scaffold22765_cov131-Isochrysis_galbana.AAC.2